MLLILPVQCIFTTRCSLNNLLTLTLTLNGYTSLVCHLIEGHLHWVVFNLYILALELINYYFFTAKEDDCIWHVCRCDTPVCDCNICVCLTRSPSYSEQSYGDYEEYTDYSNYTDRYDEEEKYKAAAYNAQASQKAKKDRLLDKLSSLLS